MASARPQSHSDPQRQVLPQLARTDTWLYLPLAILSMVRVVVSTLYNTLRGSAVPPACCTHPRRRVRHLSVVGDPTGSIGTGERGHLTGLSAPLWGTHTPARSADAATMSLNTAPRSRVAGNLLMTRDTKVPTALNHPCEHRWRRERTFRNIIKYRSCRDCGLYELLTRAVPA